MQGGRETTATPANRLPIIALLAANTISLVGSMMTLVALPWFVLQTTGSAAKTGLTGFADALPAFAVGICGGALVDRLGYKRASIIADIVSGVGVALVPLLSHTVGLAFWQLLALVFLSNLLTIPGLTGRRAMLPELATLAHWRLEQVNAAFESVQYVAFLTGPPLAGLLIALFSASNVLWLDAASYAVSALTIGVVIPVVASGARGAARGRYRDELVAGLRFLRHDRLLFALAVCLAITNMAPYFGVILPVFAKQTYGSAAALGVIIAAIGAGQLVGAVLYGAFGHRLPRRGLWITAFIVGTLGFTALLLRPPLSVLVAMLAVSSIIAGPTNPMLVTIRHERIPRELRGRVFSTFSAIANAAQPIGLALGGIAIETFGLNGTIVFVALAELAVGISMLFIPAFHEMNRPAPGYRPAEPEPA